MKRILFLSRGFHLYLPDGAGGSGNKYEEFKKIGCEVYSVSCDTHFVHKAWHDASERIRKIQYPMLADPTHRLSKDFGVYIEADGVSERGTFIVNPDGKIVAYEVNAGNVGRNADELFRKVQASQFVYEHGDQVCPAKWQPGAETLKPSLERSSTFLDRVDSRWDSDMIISRYSSCCSLVRFPFFSSFENP